jgi:broad specificity phosphatase PhoE
MTLHRSTADRIARGVLGSCLLLLACARTNASQGPTTTVIIVRHAERASPASLDPPLIEAGEARARDLAVALRDAGVQAIITTQFVRTKATAAPLARAIGVRPEVIPDSGAFHARDVAAAIRERHPGQTVLVVGHGHTIPAIIAALGAPMPQPICETMFDQLFVVTASAGSARVIRTRYGAASTPDSSCAPMRRAP